MLAIHVGLTRKKCTPVYCGREGDFEKGDLPRTGSVFSVDDAGLPIVGYKAIISTGATHRKGQLKPVTYRLCQTLILGLN